MNKELKQLAAQCPQWATVSTSGSSLVATVNALPSGKPYGPIALKIRSAKNKVAVGESGTPTRWPVACPERHINDDGTFCIGEGAINSPQTSGDAALWWEALGKFVVGQRYADKHRRWPYPRSLHHGAASKHQIELERLAKGTRFEADVHNALEFGSGWFAQQEERPHRTQPRLTNLRNPCPKGCKKRNNSIAKRKCEHKELMFQLLREEYLRRKAERDFWRQFPRKVCCGTLDDCPIARGKR